MLLALCAFWVFLGSSVSLAAPESGAVDAARGLDLVQTVAPVILDVRTDAEFAAGHVPGALHIPVDALEARLEEIPEKSILILCRTGRRAEAAWNVLHKARPQQSIWFLKAKPGYGSDGSWTFED